MANSDLEELLGEVDAIDAVEPPRRFTNISKAFVLGVIGVIALAALSLLSIGGGLQKASGNCAAYGCISNHCITCIHLLNNFLSFICPVLGFTS